MTKRIPTNYFSKCTITNLHSINHTCLPTRGMMCGSFLCPFHVSFAHKRYNISLEYPYVMGHLHPIPLTSTQVYDLLEISSALVGSFASLSLLVYNSYVLVWFTLIYGALIWGISSHYGFSLGQKSSIGSIITYDASPWIHDF